MAQVKKEYYEIVCDVCGNEAYGEWYSIEYLNGKVFAEYSCPVELCRDHMNDFVRHFSDEFKKERYENFDEKKKNELIKKLKSIAISNAHSKQTRKKI